MAIEGSGGDEVVVVKPKWDETGTMSGLSAEGLYSVEGSIGCLSTLRSGNRETLVSVTRDGLVECWDLSDGCEVTSTFGHPKVELNGDVPCVALLVSPRELWVGCTSGMMLRSSFGEHQTQRLSAQHDAAITAFFIMGDGTSLWSASLDASIVVWDIRSAEPKGSFQTGGAGIVCATPRATVETRLWLADTQNQCLAWKITEGIHHYRHADAAADDVPAAVAVLKRLGSILCGERGFRIPDQVLETVPDVQLVADALESLHDISVAVSPVLEDWEMTPENLLGDVERICGVAREAARLELTIAGRTTTGSRDRLLSLRHAAATCSALQRDLERVEQALVEAQRRAARSESQDEYAATLKRRIAELERQVHEKQTVQENAVEASSLRDELNAKNAFVMELLEIVKQNTDTIEELRTKYKSKKADAHAQAARIVEFENSNSEVLYLLRLNTEEGRLRARALLEKTLR